MIATDPPDHGPDPDSLDALLIAALDSSDQTRIAILTRVFMLRYEQDQETGQQAEPPVQENV